MALEVGHSSVQEVSLPKTFLSNRCVEGCAFLLLLMMLSSSLLGAPVVNKIDPVFEEPVDAQFRFGGFVGQRLVANLETVGAPSA